MAFITFADTQEICMHPCCICPVLWLCMWILLVIHCLLVIYIPVRHIYCTYITIEYGCLAEITGELEVGWSSVSILAQIRLYHRQRTAEVTFVRW